MELPASKALCLNSKNDIIKHQNSSYYNSSKNTPIINDFAPTLARVKQCLVVQKSTETALPMSKPLARTSLIFKHAHIYVTGS